MTGILKTVTLGCKVNQYETELVREGLVSHGYQDALSDEPADLCVVNTCTVTSEGDSKSRQVIRRLHRENPDAKIIVMGCYATRAPETIAALPGVSDVVTDKREIPDLLGRFGVVDIPQGIRGLRGRHRAYIKVQDGCLLRCSYCIIPHVRPNFYSRPESDILQEVRQLIGAGFREVVLTGIHLGHYGVDFSRGKPKSEWTRLATLVERIVNLPGDFRVRLSSIECTEVTQELLSVMQSYPEKVAPHLHICLQSGSDRILRAMRRRWSVRRIIDRCLQVQRVLDRPAITTDVIVGFPGETDEDFLQTVQACQEIGFSKIHIFPFSPRRGTPAADLPNQIPKSVRMERGRRLAQIEREMKENYLRQLLGSQLQVLPEELESTETESQRMAIGTACRYVRVKFPLEPDLTKSLDHAPVGMQIIDIQEIQGEELLGLVVNETRIDASHPSLPAHEGIV